MEERRPADHPRPQVQPVRLQARVPQPRAPWGAGPAAPRTPMDLPGGLAALRELARTSAPTLDESRRLTPELAESIRQSGFARHFVPRRRGGSAGTFATALAATAAVGEECAATAWCAALYAAHGRLASYLPEEGQADLWGAGPDVLVAAAIFPPSGEAADVPGGWRLTGRWRYASGVDHADWVLLACSTGAEGGREHRVFAVPRERCTVYDTWRTLGLRGTGSNSVGVEGVFVPAHRTFTLADLGRPTGPERCHRVPAAMVAALQFVAPALGAARGALRDFTADLAGRPLPDGRPRHELASVQDVLTCAGADVHMADLLLEKAAWRADRGHPAPLAVAENIRDGATAIRLCRSAVDRLLAASGTAVQSEDHPLQRRWRDVTAAASHATLDFEAASATYTRAVLAETPGLARTGTTTPTGMTGTTAPAGATTPHPHSGPAGERA